jgi:hypothetical protein
VIAGTTSKGRGGSRSPPPPKSSRFGIFAPTVVL